MKKGIIEPVEYQYRTRPDWLPDKWTAWERCTAGAAADYERVPLLHDWHYQVRRLYTMQQLNTSIDSLSEYHEGKGWKLGNLITSNQDDILHLVVYLSRYGMVTLLLPVFTVNPMTMFFPELTPFLPNGRNKYDLVSYSYCHHLILPRCNNRMGMCQQSSKG